MLERIVGFSLAALLVGLPLILPLAPTHQGSGMPGLYLAGAEGSGNSPPVVKILYPTWDVWITDTIDIVVKAYDPDGIANISAGVLNRFMLPLTPKEPGNTTLYEGGPLLDFVYWYEKQDNPSLDYVRVDIYVEDSLGAATVVNFTLHRPDPSNPPVIIGTPRNGSHYVKGETFLFTGGVPIMYDPCAPAYPRYTHTYSSTDTCTKPNIEEWSEAIALDGQNLFNYSGGVGSGGDWISRPYEAPRIDTSVLDPGPHNVTLSIVYKPVMITFMGVSIFYVEDPGEPTVYKVVSKSDNVIELDSPNVTITAPQVSAPAKVWVYSNAANPGSPPPYATLAGPLLIVSNATSSLGFLHIYFHVDPQQLQRLGVAINDLLPLAWDRDLDVWYPRGYYKIHPEASTVEMITTYPLLGGGLYVALASPKTPASHPSISILSPSQGAVIEGGTVTVRWKVEKGAADIVGITLTVDNERRIRLPATAESYTLNLEPGRHEITVTVEDSAGHYDSATVTITIKGDRQQPEPTQPQQSEHPRPEGGSNAKAVAAAASVV